MCKTIERVAHKTHSLWHVICLNEQCLLMFARFWIKKGYHNMKLEDLKNLSASLENLPEWIVTTNDKGEAHHLRYSHESLCLGYVKKNASAWLETEYYKGRFGKGITIKCNNPNSTRYCYKAYYIEKSRDIYNRFLLSSYREIIDNCNNCGALCGKCPFCKSYVDTDDPTWCKINFPTKWEV